MAETSDKFSSNDDVDRLSALPDTILRRILSFLDTKYAVATSVLSTRWKNLCHTLPDIVFDHSLTSKQWNKKFQFHFASFALRLMMLRKVHYINRFHLKCNFNFSDPLIVTLVRGAIWRHVREIDICQTEPKISFRTMTFPSEAFTRCSLVVLKLIGKFQFDIPESVYLPNLKVLVFQNVTLGCENSNSVKTLFCKVLEELKLSLCGSINISKFVVDMPNLKVFEYKGPEVEFQLVNELKFLDKVAIYFESLKDHNNLYRLISKMHGFKSLHLSPQALKALHSSYLLHVFKDLRSLTLGVFDLQALPDILRTTPRLQEIVIVLLHGYGDGRIAKAKDRCSLPKVPPPCFAKDLKNIEFKCCLTSKSEFELVKYFLRYGRVLQNMKIETLVQLQAEDLLAASNRISMFPKAQNKCEIHVFVSK